MLSVAFILLFYGITYSQETKKNKSKVPENDTAKVKSAVAAKPAVTIKPYAEVVPQSAKTMQSFFKVHLVNDRYLFEIPDSLLKRDILVVNRINKSAAGFKILGMIGYGGDEIGNCVIQFEKIPGDKLVMRSVSFREFSNDTTEQGLSRSLINSSYQAIQGSFPIKAINKDVKSTVIDFTDFINGDNKIFGFSALSEPPMNFWKNPLENANMITDRSYIDNIKAFPTNIEIKTVKTYNAKPPVSFELNNSMVLLPKVPMKPRLADQRVGFFANTYVDFDDNPRGAATTNYIWRWRLEPKDADMEKYKRGEPVEPKKPIVIYIDPATPKKWVPYLMAGINDWQAAFEKAGFKNAIMGKEAPLNDSTWSIEDARHSVLVYKPSAIPNAMGPSIKDPRSGEILETHINWYHSVMTLLQNWYVVQAGAIDARTHKPELDDELMGQLIRFVSSHEVGHTLGLMHNFGSSSTVPVENLRNKAWVEAYGHTPSIMDYARFNYVAQPEDHIGDKGIFPRIGDYDKWAIEWGYKLIPDAKKAADEKPVLNKWMVDKLASGKQYFYGSQLDPLSNESFVNVDPRDQNEDLGDDAMLASAYGIKNLKRIVPHLMEWLKQPDKNYDKAGNMYKEVVSQYGRYMGHVLKNIGGIYITPKTAEQAGPVFEVTDKGKQQRAMAFLQQQLFTTPYWLMDAKLYDVTSTDFSMVSGTQKQILLALLNPQLFVRLIDEERNYPTKAYPANQMLQELKQGIFSELPAHKAISIYRRDLQKTYVEGIIALLSPKSMGTDNDGLSIIKAHAKLLTSEFKNDAVHCPDTITRQHLTDMYERLNNALKLKVQ